jgi:membrane associated rhomboid family serine protease
MNALHVVLITVHATAAVLAFTLGIVVFVRIPETARATPFRAYAVCVWVAVAALMTVVVLDWGHLDVARRIAFPILGVLGVYMVWRTERARRTLRIRGERWRPAFIGHVGFVLISFFDGFCIVLAIDLRMPPWVVAAAAVFGVVVGVIAIRARVRQERGPEGLEAPA